MIDPEETANFRSAASFSTKIGTKEGKGKSATDIRKTAKFFDAHARSCRNPVSLDLATAETAEGIRFVVRLMPCMDASRPPRFRRCRIGIDFLRAHGSLQTRSLPGGN